MPFAAVEKIPYLVDSTIQLLYNWPQDNLLNLVQWLINMYGNILWSQRRLADWLRPRTKICSNKQASKCICLQEIEKRKKHFKTYLETSGSSLSQTTEFLPYFALPFIPNIMEHPSFKPLFTVSKKGQMKLPFTLIIVPRISKCDFLLLSDVNELTIGKCSGECSYTLRTFVICLIFIFIRKRTPY